MPDVNLSSGELCKEVQEEPLNDDDKSKAGNNITTATKVLM